MRTIYRVSLCIAIVAPISAQVLSTGETSGKGNSALIITGNAIYPKNYTTLANFWTQYGYGLTDRLDVMAGYGSTIAFGQTQHYATFSSNLGLLKRRHAGLDTAFFTNVSLPINHRNLSSRVFLTFAPIASRPVRLGRLTLTPYGGMYVLIPLVDNPADPIFSFPATTKAAVIGVSFPLCKNWLALFEWNPGPNLRSAGNGYMRLFPKQ